MDNLHSRLFRTAMDLAPVRLLVGRNGSRPNITDISEILDITQNQDNCRVWLDINGDLKALALVDGYQNLWFDATEDVDTSALLHEILPWALDITLRFFDEEALDACEYADSQRIKYLLAVGFVETGLRTFHYTYHPSGQSNENILPPGFVIRPLNGLNEIPAWLELHRKAHKESHLDEDYRKAMMSAPSYDPAMDFVLEASGGSLAAYCVCTLEGSQNGGQVGYTDPIAVDPDFHGRGLGKEILRYGISQLLARGASVIELGTSSENLPMQRLAESVGFEITEEKIWLRYEIKPK